MNSRLQHIVIAVKNFQDECETKIKLIDDASVSAGKMGSHTDADSKVGSNLTQKVMGSSPVSTNHFNNLGYLCHVRFLKFVIANDNYRQRFCSLFNWP